VQDWDRALSLKIINIGVRETTHMKDRETPKNRERQLRGKSERRVIPTPTLKVNLIIKAEKSG